MKKKFLGKNFEINKKIKLKKISSKSFFVKLNKNEVTSKFETISKASNFPGIKICRCQNPF